MSCNSGRCVPSQRTRGAFSSPFDAVIADPAFAPFFSNVAAVQRDRSSLALDISETPEALLVRASVPGFSRDQVSLEIDDGVLTITAARAQENEETTERYQRRERHTGTLARAVRLPAEVDQGQITAELKEGVLTLRLPKTPATKPQKIQIQ
jgi:HSP20 family protein